MSKVVKECPADPVEFLIGKLQAIQRQRRKVSYIYDCMQAFFVHGGGGGWKAGEEKKLSPCCMWTYVSTWAYLFAGCLSSTHFLFNDGTQK